MKNITILLAFIFAFNSWSVAPYGIKGQKQSGTLYSNVHQFPNNLVTNTGGINALVETGNNNLLVNPSFEHLTASTGWTLTAGTLTENLVNEIHGNKAASIALSSQTLNLTQDSTLYASEFAGSVQGLASVRIKTSVAGLKVCARQAGVTSTSLCVNVQANNQWGLYKVPFILSATSNGIAVTTSSAVTGTVLVDDAFVGAVDIAASVDQSKFIGSLVYAGTNGCSWSITSTSFVNFAANATCPTPTVTGSIQAPSTKIPAFVFPAGSLKGKYQIVAKSQFYNGSGGFNGGWRLSDGTTSTNKVGHYCSSVQCAQGTMVFNYDLTDNTTAKTIQFQAATTSGSMFINPGDPINLELSFEVYYFATGNTYTSTNADTDWAACNFSTLAWQSFGTVSQTLMCKRQGSDLLIQGKFVAGTTSGTTPQIPLPLWNGSQLTSAGSSVIPSTQSAGRLIRGNAAANGTKDFNILVSPSSQFLNVSFPEFSLTNNPLVPYTLNIVSAGESSSIEARIPIAGWENSNIIIGQFNGLETCANTLDCTDTFSTYTQSAGTVRENVDWLNGNASASTGIYTYTFNSGVFTVAPNCVSSAESNSSPNLAVDCTVTSTSSSQVVVRCSQGGTNTNYAHSLICQKQGVDYIGKTAKAVASDQNVRSIGSTGMDLQSVFFGSGANCATQCTSGTCTICNQVGSKITSVTWVATGQYRLNGIDGTKYICSGTGVGGAYQPLFHDRPSSTSTYALLISGSTTAANAAYNSVNCIGIP